MIPGLLQVVSVQVARKLDANKPTNEEYESSFGWIFGILFCLGVIASPFILFWLVIREAFNPRSNARTHFGSFFS